MQTEAGVGDKSQGFPWQRQWVNIRPTNLPYACLPLTGDSDICKTREIVHAAILPEIGINL